MKAITFTHFSICGIDELPGHAERTHTHVLSLVDPNRAEIEALETFGAHTRRMLNFHDIIDAADDKILPTEAHVAEILAFGRSFAPEKNFRLLVHCHLGVSRSTAATLALLAQANQDDTADSLFEKLRHIRPRAWPNSRMVQFTEGLLDYRGELLSSLRRHYARQLRDFPELRDLMTRLKRHREIEMAI